MTLAGTAVFIWDGSVVASDALGAKVPTPAGSDTSATSADLLGAAACVANFLSTKAVCQRTGSFIVNTTGQDTETKFIHKTQLIEAADLATAFTKAKAGV